MASSDDLDIITCLLCGSQSGHSAACLHNENPGMDTRCGLQRPVSITRFETGAHRSSTTAGATNPTDYSQFSDVAARLHGETQAEGNEKYGYGNWMNGIPVSNLLSHALAHIYAILNGDLSENHFGHAIWNLDKAAHFYERRPDLIDIKPLRDALIAKGVINQ